MVKSNAHGVRLSRGVACAAAVFLVSIADDASAQTVPPLEPAPVQPAPTGEPAPITEVPAAAPAPAAEPTGTAMPEPFKATDASKDTDATLNRDRSVGGHQFIFPAFVQSPFIATYLGLRIRLAQFRVPNLPTTLGPLSLTAVTFYESFDGGLKLTDWLGVFINAEGRSLLSTNLKSLIYQGATFDYGGSAGLLLRLLRSDRTGTLVSLRGSFGYTTGQVASFAPLFGTADTTVALRTAILTSGPGEVIRTPVSATAAQGGVTAAQALGRLFGLQASLGLGWTTSSLEPFNVTTGTRTKRTVDGVTYRLGLAASMDLAPKRVPLAVMAEYSLSRQPSVSQVVGADELRAISTLYAGVYYSGRKDLQLGLGAGVELNLPPARTAVGTSDRPQFLLTQVVLRYVW